MRKATIRFQTVMLTMDEYIAYLKGSSEKMAMPVVFPPKSLGMENWNDFRPDLIKELKKKLSDEK